MTDSPYISYNGSGGYIDYADPKPEQIDLHDIAIALSREARYNGQVGLEYGYSVAQHSVIVSLLVPKEHALAGLLHDGSEAYLRDIATPAKRLLPDYHALEAKVQGAVYSAFGLPAVLCDETQAAIKLADQIALATEVAYLMPAEVSRAFNCCSYPVEEAVFARSALVPASPQEAKTLFLKRFESIIFSRVFQYEYILWAAQEYEITLSDAAVAATCFRNAISHWSYGRESLAQDFAFTMALHWPAPYPPIFRGTPLAIAFAEGYSKAHGSNVDELSAECWVEFSAY